MSEKHHDQMSLPFFFLLCNYHFRKDFGKLIITTHENHHTENVIRILIATIIGEVVLVLSTVLAKEIFFGVSGYDTNELEILLGVVGLFLEPSRQVSLPI